MIKQYFQTINLGLGDIAAIVIGIAVVGGFLYASVNYSNRPRSSGFGPEWQCSSPGGRGGPDFCVKKPAPQTPPKS